MSKSSQRKGRAGELELCRILQNSGIDAAPGQAVSFGRTPDVLNVPGIHVECKRSETLRLSEWMQQAVRDSEKFHDGAPAVFHRRSRSPWLVTMNLTDWISLYLSAESGKERRNET